MKRQILKAGPGMVLTDGNVYGKEILLAVGEDASRFKEITDERHWELMAESEEMPDD
jgi:hypothetical protein